LTNFLSEITFSEIKFEVTGTWKIRNDEGMFLLNKELAY